VIAPGPGAIYREESGIDSPGAKAGNIQLDSFSQRVGVLAQVSDHARAPRVLGPTLAVQSQVAPADVGDGAVVVRVDDDGATVEFASCFLVHL
jgi:hypothetical protein